MLIAGNIGAWKFSGSYFNSNPNPFIHLWSLSVEEQIYISIPVILLTLVVTKIMKSRRHFIIILIFIFLISLVFSVFMYKSSLKIGIDDALGVLFYSPTTRIIQFILGGIWSFRSKKVATRKIPGEILKIFSVLFLVVIFFFDLNYGFPLNSLLITFLTLIILHMESLNLFQLKLIGKMAQIGNKSYSLYLVHMPIAVILELSPFFLRLSELQKIFLSFILTYFFGTCLYVFVEKKFRLLKSVSIYPLKFHKYILTFFIFPLTLIMLLLTFVLNNYLGIIVHRNSLQYAADLVNCDLSKSNKPCQFNTDSLSGSTILVGDSQAGSLSLSFISRAAKFDHKAYIWVRPSCKFILVEKLKGDFNLYEKKLPSGCLKHNSRIIKWLKLNPNSNVIIMNSESSDFQEISANFESILEISKYSRRVIFVTPIPKFSDYDTFLSRNQSLFQYNENWPKQVDSSEILARSDFFQSSVTLLSKVDNVQIIEPKKILCSNGVCKRYLENNWLFFDAAHLSIEGADFLFNSYSKTLENFFKL